jgi:hypothetical protein
MFEGQENYASYLLRLWQHEEQGQPVWRASLESTSTGERLYFTSTELLAFLRTRLMAQGEDVPNHESGA